MTQSLALTALICGLAYAIAGLAHVDADIALLGAGVSAAIAIASALPMHATLNRGLPTVLASQLGGLLIRMSLAGGWLFVARTQGILDPALPIMVGGCLAALIIADAAVLAQRSFHLNDQAESADADAQGHLGSPALAGASEDVLRGV